MVFYIEVRMGISIWNSGYDMMLLLVVYSILGYGMWHDTEDEGNGDDVVYMGYCCIHEAFSKLWVDNEMACIHIIVYGKMNAIWMYVYNMHNTGYNI